MTRKPRRPKAAAPPLHRALDQTAKVKDKVKEAAVELSDVNLTLKDNVATGAPLQKVQHALDKSQAVEVKVEEAAEELVAVSDALTEEVAERGALEHKLREGESALSHSASTLSACQAAEEEARHAALHDAVTGLPNSTLFGDRLENALEQARRHSWRLAVLFIDLDEFKAVNDTHGHDMGDRVLQQVGRHLVDAIRGGDSVGRRGGDEFLVLMLEVQDDDSAIALATKLCDLIGEPMLLDGIAITVGASIGVAVFPDDGATATELLKHADIAMYVAKKGQLGVARHTVPTMEPHEATPLVGASSSSGDSA